MRIFTCFAVLTGAIAISSYADIQTKTIEYELDGTKLVGYMAYDDAIEGARPGVLVIHEWWGLNDYAKKRARQLAELGYAAFALDMYGNGFNTESWEEAGAQSGKLKDDRALMRKRAQTGMDVLKSQAPCDANRTAAIGYCFGGTCVLELARSGADVDGVVSFHGGLDTPYPEDARNIKGQVLICHGADDPHVPEEEVKEFQQEMLSGNVDWVMESYGGAVHAFTNPGMGDDPSKGVAYNEEADKRSWKTMQKFFEDIFQ